MNTAEALDFLRRHHRCVLATHRKDSSIQMSPVLAVTDGQDRILVSSREPAAKVRNLRRDPRATLLVLDKDWFGPWALLEGRAEIVALPEAMDLLVDYYRRASGEHSDWDGYRAAMERERRVVVRFAVERAGPTYVG